METSTMADKTNIALQVALQTMKERCIQLQRRLTTVEDENQRLREVGDTLINSSSPAECMTPKSNANETEQLRSKVDELQRQKTLLTQQINMVSDENRKLWSRLSQMSKEQPQSNGGSTDHDGATMTKAGRGGIVNQNLIRSKTFTQHSPNPNLRQKLITDRPSDSSLEEIDLMGAGEAFASADAIELGYAYMPQNDGSNVNETDFNLDAKGCMEGLQELRREAMKQQQELTLALTMLESKMVIQPCPDCAQKAQKSEMTNKVSTATTQEMNGHINRTTPTPSVPMGRINILQEKIKADAIDKTCPMCCKVYSSHVSFEEFQTHVEMHFLPDDTSTELESSIERNFEFISHAVGDF